MAAVATPIRTRPGELKAYKVECDHGDKIPWRAHAMIPEGFPDPRTLDWALQIRPRRDDSTGSATVTASVLSDDSTADELDITFLVDTAVLTRNQEYRWDVQCSGGDASPGTFGRGTIVARRDVTRP